VRLPDIKEQPTVSIEEAGQIVGWGRSAAYEAARNGTLRTITISQRRKRVPTAALYRLLEVPLPD
jgi:hypothetical protein